MSHARRTGLARVVVEAERVIESSKPDPLLADAEVNS
jgi:hypothetical protein